MYVVESYVSYATCLIYLEYIKLLVDGVAILSFFLTPFVFLAKLLFLFWGPVVLDVKGLADLGGRFASDHLGNRTASHIQKRRDVKVHRSL